MANITNNFAEGSCTFQAGSSQNGDVTINGPIYQGETKPKEQTPNNLSDIGSPLQLSKNASKIDLIRIMNAWYECGKVVDVNGAKPTKRISSHGLANSSILTFRTMTKTFQTQ